MGALDKLNRKIEEDRHKKKAPMPKKAAIAKPSDSKPAREPAPAKKEPDRVGEYEDNISVIFEAPAAKPEPNDSTTQKDAASAPSKPDTEGQSANQELRKENTEIYTGDPDNKKEEIEASVSPAEDHAPDRTENKGGRPNERGQKNKDYKMLNVAIPISLYNSLKEMGGGNMTYFARTLLQEGIDNRMK